MIIYNANMLLGLEFDQFLPRLLKTSETLSNLT